MASGGDSSSFSDLAEDILSHISAFPPWSIAAHVLVAGVVLAIQRAVSESQQFSSLNEYLCTLLWVCWSLEMSVIGFASSNFHALFTLFVRLLLWPFLFHDACVNPCNSVYMAVKGKSVKNVPRYFGIQFIAMATGLLYSAVTWRFLSSWVSDTHLSFMSSRANPFLNVSIVAGFLLELAMSFAMYLPRLVMRTGFTCTFVSAVLTCVMIILLEHTTGAFMNPLIALSLSLLWHYGSLSMSDFSVLLFVYWLAPLLGTVLAARLDVWISRTQRKFHVS